MDGVAACGEGTRAPLARTVKLALMWSGDVAEITLPAFAPPILDRESEPKYKNS